MASYNIEMQKRNADDTGWDKLYPVTKDTNVFDANGVQISKKVKKTDAWIDVKEDFGAVGDGVTDDSEAIQNALNNLNVNNGGVLFFPLGIYKITSTIIIPNSTITIEGIGINSVILGSLATMFKLTGDTGYLKRLEIKNIKFEITDNNLIFDFTRTFTAAPTPSMLLRDVWFKGLQATLVKMNTVRETYIDNCIFEGGGIIENTAQLLLSDTINFNINNCIFYRGMQPNPGGTGLLLDDTIDSEYRSEGLMISNCIFIDLKYGICCDGVLEASITDNMIDQIDNPIIIKNTTSFRIENNYIAARLNDATVISILNDSKNSEDGIITNNRIINERGNGICINAEAVSPYYLNSLQVKDNRVIQYSVAGVNLKRVVNSIIESNTFDGNGGKSIIESDGSGNCFNNNFAMQGIQVFNAVTRDNKGFKTRNAGTATIINGQSGVTIPHGLVAPPNIIKITPTNDGIFGKQYYAVASGANISLYLSSDATKDTTFCWEVNWNDIV
jgi:hypothetical protein